MSDRRRRAHNFTDALNSFRTMESETDTENDVLLSFSEDSLNDMTSKDNVISRNTTHRKHSIIVAGSFTNEMSVFSNGSDSLMHSMPDLNKRIELFPNENLNRQDKRNIPTTCQYVGSINNKENNDPQCPMQNTLRDLLMPSSQEKLPCSGKRISNDLSAENPKRDRNCNIEIMAKSVNVPEGTVLREKQSPRNNDSSISQDSLYTSQFALTERLQNTSDRKSIESVNKINESERSDNDFSKFETLLCSLDNQLNQIKEVSQPQQTLKRLSDVYVHSPKNFTEKLLTIIEESVANNDENQCDTSTLDLSRLTTEFRKMCKFIEDESSPEWPPSPLSLCAGHITPMCSKNNTNKVHENDKSILSLCKSKKSITTTPALELDSMKESKRRHRTVSRTSFNACGSEKNILPLHEDSNASFECLEAECKRLYSDEEENSQPVRKSSSFPSLLSMSDIQLICEQQIASLNDSDVAKEDHEGNLAKCNTQTSINECSRSSTTNPERVEYLCTQQLNSIKLEHDERLKTPQNVKVSSLEARSKRISSKCDSDEEELYKVNNIYTMVDPDQLEKTLLQDIAEKRKRCLDTAKCIKEINADPEVIKAKKSLKLSPMATSDNDTHSLTNSDMSFINTLMSCKNYHVYLKKQKPLLDLLNNSNLFISNTTPEQNYANIVEHNKMEKTPLSANKSHHVNDNNLSPNMKSYMYKSPLSSKEHKETKERLNCKKPKLFVTPGKSPVKKNCRRKPVYFPDMDKVLKKPLRDNIFKSPHAEGLCRLNYNTTVSPVGMYIRGIDTQLMKNIHARRNGLLLTPIQKKATSSPTTNLGDNALSKNISKTKEKVSLKVNLSPKLYLTPKYNRSHGYKEEGSTPKIPGNDNTHNDFVLPKVSYKLPLQVQTIKEKTTPKIGNRMKTLLKSSQTKIVIKHQGRTNSIQTKTGVGGADREIVEINYKPEDDSIHVEQEARKTNFIYRQKNT